MGHQLIGMRHQLIGMEHQIIEMGHQLIGMGHQTREIPLLFLHTNNRRRSVILLFI